jgi:hypothetical protein
MGMVCDEGDIYEVVLTSVHRQELILGCRLPGIFLCKMSFIRGMTIGSRAAQDLICIGVSHSPHHRQSFQLQAKHINLFGVITPLSFPFSPDVC